MKACLLIGHLRLFGSNVTMTPVHFNLNFYSHFGVMVKMFLYELGNMGVNHCNQLKFKELGEKHDYYFFNFIDTLEYCTRLGQFSLFCVCPMLGSITFVICV